MPRKRYEIIASTFDKKGNLIASGMNSYKKSHTLQKYFSEKVKMNSERIYLHSELASLLKSKGKDVHSVLVQRFDNEGKPKNARPCPSCVEAMKAWGVIKVKYTVEGGFKSEYIKEM